jgi:hypothetical protein
VRPGRDQDAPGLEGACRLALLDEDDRGAADRDRARAGPELGTRALGGLDQLPAAEIVPAEGGRVSDDEPGAGLLEDLAAEGWTFVDDRDREAGVRRLGAGGEPCRPAADDEEIDAAAVAQRQAGIWGSGAPIVDW